MASASQRLLERIGGRCDGSRAELTIPADQDVSATLVLRFQQPSGEVVWEYRKHVVMLEGELTELVFPTGVLAMDKWREIRADDVKCWIDLRDLRPPTTHEVDAHLAEQRFLEAILKRGPRMWRGTGRLAVDTGRHVCDDAAHGIEHSGFGLDLDGPHALAWYWGVAENHGSAKTARLAVQYLCPQLQPVLETALTLGPPPR